MRSGSICIGRWILPCKMLPVKEETTKAGLALHGEKKEDIRLLLEI